jgi:O-antigen ligase
LLLAFAAVATRAFLRNFLPGVASRLHMVNGGEPVPSAAATWPSISGNGNGTGPWPLTETAESPASQEDPRATRPLPITPREDNTGDGEADVLRPARWPARPAVALVTPAEAVRTRDEVARAVNGRPGPNHALPQVDENPSSVVVRPSSGAVTASSVWSRFMAWNRQDAFAGPAVVLLILGAVSLLTLADPTFAPDSARAYRWMIIEPVLLYFLMTDVLKTRRGLLRMLDFFVAGAVLVALYGLFQYVTHNGVLVVEGVSRIPGVYQHPNNLALYLGRVVPFVVCAALFLPAGPRKVLYALTALPLGAAFLLTFSRGAWVGAAVAVVLAVSLGLRWPSGWTTPRLPRAFKLWLGGVAASAVVLVVLVAVLFPKLPERVFSFGSGFTRFTIWESALRMAVDHPVTGVGPDQFLNQFRAQYGPEQCRDQNAVPPAGAAGEGTFAECYTSHPHNIFLDYWLSLGIMGLFALVWLVWRYYREAILLAKWAASRAAADPVVRALAIGLVAIVTDFLVHGLVDNSYFLMDLALIFWMSCGVVQLLRVESRRSLVEPAAPQ